MERELLQQAAALLLACLLGMAAGLLYDLLRPPRRVLRQPWAAMVDLLYGLCVFTGLFLFAMSAGDGRLGLWELSTALLGFLLICTGSAPYCCRFLPQQRQKQEEDWKSLEDGQKNLRKSEKKLLKFERLLYYEKE